MAKHNAIIFILYLAKCFCAEGMYGQVMLDSVVIKDKSYTHQHLTEDYKASEGNNLTSTDFIYTIKSGQLHMSNPGGLQTLLHRGMGHRHLAILWQGINIQNLLNGSYDLGLIPIFLMPEARFYTLGNPALQGNNGFAGAIDLQPSSVPDKSWRSYVSASTLRNFGAGIQWFAKGKKMRSEIGVDYGYDFNSYTYKYNNMLTDRTTTDFEKINITTNITLLIAKNQSINLYLWFQNADRKIPVSTTSAPIDQSQHDQNVRAQIRHSYYLKNSKVLTTCTVMKEQLDYKTPSIDSRSNVQSIISSIQWMQNKDFTWQASMQYRNDIATPNFYPQTKTRNTLQASASQKWHWTKEITTNLAVRQDVVDKQWMPLSWNIHTSCSNFTLALSRNYNLPGLNDLYWPIGGNPKLKTEKSLQSELKYDIVDFPVRIQTALYIHYVRDWIQWLPALNGLFAPENQKTVLSRGFDLKCSRNIPFSRWNFTPTLYYNYNITNALDHYFDPDLIGKQIIYIPKHKAGVQLGWEHGNHYFGFHYDFISKRFDTPDESSSLAPIHLVSTFYKLKSKQFQIELQANNLLHYNYEMTRFFPLPGIHFNTRFIFQISHNNN